MNHERFGWWIILKFHNYSFKQRARDANLKNKNTNTKQNKTNRSIQAKSLLKLVILVNLWNEINVRNLWSFVWFVAVTARNESQQDQSQIHFQSWKESQFSKFCLFFSFDRKIKFNFVNDVNSHIQIAILESRDRCISNLDFPIHSVFWCVCIHYVVFSMLSLHRVSSLLHHIYCENDQK